MMSTPWWSLFSTFCLWLLGLGLLAEALIEKLLTGSTLPFGALRLYLDVDLWCWRLVCWVGGIQCCPCGLGHIALLVGG